LAEQNLIPAGPPSGSVPPAEGGQKKPYHRPRIASREPLEAMAATCTGVGAVKAVAPCNKLQS